ncbi:NnrS family protein [Neptunomonas sp.]|uniref:NnrS family protein n=1 Tax=Neptunomonas sp. TaxID=1971898 RepID=UPI0035656CF1
MAIIMFEKYPASRWETLLSNGFRLLFLCVAAAGVILMGLWLAILKGFWYGSSIAVPLVQWHAHEMMFGLVGAAIGGFLLAAVSKWTNRLPVSGMPLAILVLCWILGRLVMLSSAQLPYGIVAAVDLLYGVLLVFIIGREIMAGGNKRNYKIVVMLGLFSVFNLLFHLGHRYGVEYSEMALRGVIMQISLMIALIGGRITPSFTRNYLVQKEPDSDKPLPMLFNRFDMFVSASLVVAAIFWVVLPVNVITGGLLCLAGVAQWARIGRWQGQRILAEPLLWVLHLGFVWLGAGLVLLGLSAFSWVNASAGLHAIGIGAMAGMILGVASRAALGHTQRALVAGKMMSIAFVLISITALLRVAAALVGGVAYEHFILSAGVIWLVSFVLFCIRYVPILISPAPGWKNPG